MMMGLFVPFLGVLLFQQLAMVGGTCNSKLESDLFDDLLSMMSKFKRSEFGNNLRKARDIPAFSASSTVAKHLVVGEIVKFDKVWTNNKNCYNPTTGVFTAPKTGLYQVSAIVMSSKHKSLYVHLWKNENRMVALYAPTGYNEATANTVLNLKKKDGLYLKVAGGSTAIHNTKVDPYNEGKESAELQRANGAREMKVLTGEVKKKPPTQCPNNFILKLFGQKSDLFDDLLSMMSKFKRSEFGNNPRKARDIPAFSASSTVAKGMVAGDVVKFDKVWTNNKNCYNSTTGVFTAPKTGLYQVSAIVMSASSKAAYVHLWQNENPLMALYGPVGYNQATANTVLNLKKNDRLYLKVRNGSRAIYNNKVDPYSTFSGYLISE